ISCPLSYSMVLTGAAFLCRSLLQYYNSDTDIKIRQMREIVSTLTNGEDIAMNFVSRYYYPDLHPTFVPGRIHEDWESYKTGLSYNPSHQFKRSYVLNEYSKIFGENLLKQIK